MRRFRRSTAVAILAVGIALCGLTSALAYNLPFVQERVAWRVSELRARIKYALFPPEEAVFTPNPTVAAMVQRTLAALTPTPTASPTPVMVILIQLAGPDDIVTSDFSLQT